MKKKNILIVGGTGFIGYHLSKKCLNLGWKVDSISTTYPNTKRFIKNVNYHICDIRKKGDLKKINRNFQYVVNLGGYVDHSNKKKTYESHYIGCKNLANLFLKKKIKSFIQIGSSIEYGQNKSPQRENMNCLLSKINSVYGESKLRSTNFLISLNKKYNFPVTILRLYLAYGPNQELNRFIPIVIDGCLKNTEFNASSGKQRRDFIHVHDVVNIIIRSLINKKANGEIFNVGSGKPLKLKKIIELIRKLSMGGKPKYGSIPLRKDEILNLYPDISKAKKFLNWSPKKNFETGLKETIKYYKNNLK